MAKLRTRIPDPLCSQILIANQHACCVCGKPGVQVHHIDGDPTHHQPENLAVLCLPHHDEATSVTGLSAKLSSTQIRRYKCKWEKQCHDRVMRAARGRTAFFMVDYKNAERIRQVYDQLTQAECQQAYEILTAQFQEEEQLRKKQGFEISTEPNTSWNEHTRRCCIGFKRATPTRHYSTKPRDTLATRFCQPVRYGCAPKYLTTLTRQSDKVILRADLSLKPIMITRLPP